MESYKLVLIFALCITLCYAKVDASTDANNVNPSEKLVNSTAPAEKQTYNTAVQSSFFPSKQKLRIIEYLKHIYTRITIGCIF